jgi:hypothetical protein
MSRKYPSRDEFDITSNQVVHTPTGATWIADLGDAEPKVFNVGKLGGVLPNGDEYRAGEVCAMATRLLRERLK